MLSRLEIKDPIFAAYLISKGCQLVTIEPFFRENPKKYIFDKTTRDACLDRPFYGVGVEPERTSWMNFVNWVNNLQIIEDQLIRQSSHRSQWTGVEVWPTKRLPLMGQNGGASRTVFVTTDQGVAAYLLENEDSILTNVYGLGKNRGFLYIFSDHKRARELYKEMMTGEKENSWWNMKCCYKRVTSIRHCLMRNEVEQEENERRSNRAGGVATGS